jgi:hypothetical protein
VTNAQTFVIAIITLLLGAGLAVVGFIYKNDAAIAAGMTMTGAVIGYVFRDKQDVVQ